MKLYIAYGSNLNLGQMERRCPGAKVLYKGIVKDYSLVYRGSKTGAYATIVPQKGDFVPVAVWEINSVHERRLDIYEGYPNFYYKKELPVILDDNSRIWGMAYIMFDGAKTGRPSEEYLRTCLRGYLDNGLNINKFENSIKNNEKELLR
ncbi:MAG: gamma-glutamylcyclotransferase family protein [Clostridia bacterium]|nr:gamma-glutamylcyclotransferase family protein [Clostridia bacterium]